MEFSSYAIFLFILYNLAVFIPSFSSSIKPRCRDNERSALLQFEDSFFSTNSCLLYSDYSKVESWKFMGSVDCCKWDGVECDDRTNHVIGLNLSHSCIYASINSNSTLFDLVHLRSLSLAANYFYPSQIPPRIGELSSLTYLNLSSSYFYGQIPAQLRNLSNLISLDLSTNHLSLQKPSFGDMVRQLTNLKELDLSRVNISSSVPELLSNFSSLESLRLESCRLTGEFPVAIFQLPNLKILDLSNNAYLKTDLPSFQVGTPLKSLNLYETNYRSGTNSTVHVPISVGNLIHLEELLLSDCNLTPSSIENLVNLKFLTIIRCIFTGQIPPTFGNFTNLVSLFLSYNDLGIYPPTTSSFTWIGKLTKLTRLALKKMNMHGELPSSWFMNLTRLSTLNMYDNQLTGPLPLSLMNLTQLENIGLSYNQLSGQIPFQIGHLTSLSSLDLSFNQLEGGIPASFSHLSNLQTIILTSNKLSGVVDFTIFSELTYLGNMFLSNNYFSSTTKTKSNVSFENLYVLHLASCNLSEFPTILHNQLGSLVDLDLTSNNIRGQIPSWSGLKSLQHLQLSHNHLTGFDNDSSILQWTRLRTIHLSSNMLQGSLPMPPPLTLCYIVSDNKISGELSPSICNLNSLGALDLSFNNFSGKLPQCLGNFSDSMSMLDLKGNSFSGTIPLIWRNACEMKMIRMSKNQLQGQLPKSLLNCSSLEMVDFGSNQIIDAFPSWLGSLPNLQILILRSNGFYGTMENSVATGFPSLRIIDLSHNHFTGTLPSKLLDIWNAMKVVNTSQLRYMQDPISSYSADPLSNFFGSYAYSMTLYNKGLEMNYMKISDLLVAIDFSYNKFQGEIPDIMRDLKGLRLLNLSGNSLIGVIPSSLADLKALECLDLSQNQLSGQIPTELTELTFLSSFDVSFNNLSGPVPQGNQFCNFESKSYEGNPRLWVDTWTKQCGNSNSTPDFVPPSFTEEVSTESEFKINWIVVSMGYASGIVVGVIAGNEFVSRKQHWFAKRIKKKNRRHRQARRRARN